MKFQLIVMTLMIAVSGSAHALECRLMDIVSGAQQVLKDTTKPGSPSGWVKLNGSAGGFEAYFDAKSISSDAGSKELFNVEAGIVSKGKIASRIILESSKGFILDAPDARLICE